MRNWRSEFASGDTETKITLSEFQLYISANSISLAFKQAQYELCSLYKTKVIIIFSGGHVPKMQFLMNFTPLHHRNCMIQDAEILQEYYFLWVYKLINIHWNLRIVCGLRWYIMEWLIWYLTPILQGCQTDFKFGIKQFTSMLLWWMPTGPCISLDAQSTKGNLHNQPIDGNLYNHVYII
jgi:hypothetical protein